MKTQSIWKMTKTRDCPKVESDLTTDVLIIGGGITGFSVLYHLKDSNLKVTLVERNECGLGVTSKSTAKITYLQDNTIINISTFTSERIACKYIRSQIEATHLLSGIIEREHIDCDLKKCDFYLFTNTSSGKKKLGELSELLKESGVEVESTENVPFTEPCTSSLKVEDTYVFHPLKYIASLKEKFYSHIYEHSKVEKIDKIEDRYICQVNGHKIKTKYVVLATHYPYFLIPFLFPLKSHIEVSYLGATRTAEFQNYSAINVDNPTISMRFHTNGQDTYFIYLLNSYTTSKVKNIKANFEELVTKEKFDYLWSNNDIITSDAMPYIGCLNKDDPSLILATGYNTWGMTNGTLAGKMIADIILDKPNEYISLFDPHRHLNLGKVVNFPLDIAHNITSYIKSSKNNENNRKVTYTKKDGQNVAIFKDKDGIEHIVLNRCPHMKCGLVLNETEGTWDCLCHGSRFDLDGHCIEGPSNYDIIFHTKNNRDY